MTEPFVTTEILTKIICSWFLLLRSKTDLLLRLFNTKTVSVGSSLFLLLVRFNFEKKCKILFHISRLISPCRFPEKEPPSTLFSFRLQFLVLFMLGTENWFGSNVGTAAAQMLALLLLKCWHCCCSNVGTAAQIKWSSYLYHVLL